MRLFKKNKSSKQRGALLLESAIGLPLFFLTVFSGIDIIRLSLASATFQHSVNSAGRYATLGFHHPGDGEVGVDSVSQKITELAGVPLSNFEICRTGAASCPANTRGNQNDWIQIKGETNMPVLFGAYTVKLRARTLVRNEPNFELVDEPEEG